MGEGRDARSKRGDERMTASIGCIGFSRIREPSARSACMGTILDIEAVIGDPAGLGLTREEREDLLAVSYLAMRADGHLTAEEQDAFERSSQLLLGGAAQLDVMSRHFEGIFAAKGQDGMLEEVAGRLARPAAREEAYKLAYVMTLSDLDTNDDEFLFEDELRVALGIEEDRAAELMDAVIEAIDVSGDDED